MSPKLGDNQRRLLRLKRTPGEWKVVTDPQTYESAKNWAYRVRRGQLGKNLEVKPGEFEAEWVSAYPDQPARRWMTMWVVRARYVGDVHHDAQ